MMDASKLKSSYSRFARQVDLYSTLPALRQFLKRQCNDGRNRQGRLLLFGIEQLVSTGAFCKGHQGMQTQVKTIQAKSKARVHPKTSYNTSWISMLALLKLQPKRWSINKLHFHVHE